MTEELITGALALDDTHLELDKALPEDFGQRVKVHIIPLHPAQNHVLREPQATYRVETASEIRTQVVLDAKQAMLAANRFIVEHLPDRFSAGLPKLVIFPLRPLWLVPVHLTYPGIGIVGEVGMLAVSGDRPAIVGWTPTEEMEALARQLYEEHRNEIELAFS
ncbi:MAG: hypothetical protein KKC18_09185 [Chloroflexi bacterium]|nr:hypothetical protein [Chloroflexota bacterium]